MRKPILVNRDNPVPPGYQDSIEVVEIAVEEGFSVPMEKRTASSIDNNC